ncbi:hypothetical protein D3C81_2106020 [compost metagenome]
MENVWGMILKNKVYTYTMFMQSVQSVSVSEGINYDSLYKASVGALFRYYTQSFTEISCSDLIRSLIERWKKNDVTGIVNSKLF